jgi:hypothetical protein
MYLSCTLGTLDCSKERRPLGEALCIQVHCVGIDPRPVCRRGTVHTVVEVTYAGIVCTSKCLRAACRPCSTHTLTSS